MNYLIVFPDPKDNSKLAAKDTGTTDRSKAMAAARDMALRWSTPCSVVQPVGGFAANTRVVEHDAEGNPIP